MLASFSWMKEYIDTALGADEAAARLTAQGFEVKELARLRTPIPGLVVGKILSAAKHPDADRLQVCQVETEAGTLAIVCGAANARAGLKVCVATVGTTLAPDFTIKRSKIRGVESSGMLCSRAELGLEKESAGIWELPADASLADPITQFVGPEEQVFDIELTSNRSDCLSIIGLSQELAVALREHLVLKKHRKFPEKKGVVALSVHAREKTPRYTARLVTGVKIGPSPSWMQDRLTLHGLRPINNVVDITNYILLEYGQPLHAFDYKSLVGQKLTARDAQAGEKFDTLDGRLLELTPDDLVIADEQGPVALAGVMGGKRTGVTEATREVLVESACFEPLTVRRTARRHKIATDSSARFEKGVAWDRVEEALHYCVDLLCEHAGGAAASAVMDVHTGRPKETLIVFRYGQVKQKLAVELAPVEVNKIFNSLGCTVKYHDHEKAQILVPFSRRDLKEEWDLLEEVARIHGYDNIPEALPLVSNRDDRVSAPDTKPWRESLRGLGYQEVMNVAFADSRVLTALQIDRGAHAAVVNPMSPDYTCLRRDLFAGMLQNVKHNLEHQKGQTLKFWESGRVFSKGEGPDSFLEARQLGFMLTGPVDRPNWTTPSRSIDFHDLCGDMASFLASLGLGSAKVESSDDSTLSPLARGNWVCAGLTLGRLGRVRDEDLAALSVRGEEVFYGELDLEKVDEARKRAGEKRRFTAYSAFPSVSRDLAFVMAKEAEVVPVAEYLRKADPAVVQVVISDLFTGAPVGPERKSVVFSVEFGSPEKTFTREEVDAIEKKLVESSVSRFNVTRR
jgi:phenylalanyl-tRNA synthetase beta chain